MTKDDCKNVVNDLIAEGEAMSVSGDIQTANVGRRNALIGYVLQELLDVGSVVTAPVDDTVNP